MSYSKQLILISFSLAAASWMSSASAGVFFDVGGSHAQRSLVTVLNKEYTGAHHDQPLDVRLVEGMKRYSAFNLDLGLGYRSSQEAPSYFAAGLQTVFQVDPSKTFASVSQSGTGINIDQDSDAGTPALPLEGTTVELKQPWAVDLYAQYGAHDFDTGSIYVSAGLQLGEMKRGGAIFDAGTDLKGKTFFHKTITSSLTMIPQLGFGYRLPTSLSLWGMDLGFDVVHHFAASYKFKKTQGVDGTADAGTHLKGDALYQSFSNDVASNNDIRLSARFHM